MHSRQVGKQSFLQKSTPSDNETIIVQYGSLRREATSNLTEDTPISGGSLSDEPASDTQLGEMVQGGHLTDSSISASPRAFDEPQTSLSSAESSTIAIRTTKASHERRPIPSTPVEASSSAASSVNTITQSVDQSQPPAKKKSKKKHSKKKKNQAAGEEGRGRASRREEYF